jgi:uncharacterized membrane protein YeiH
MNWRAPEWRRSSLRRAPRDADLPDVASAAVFAATGAPVASRSRLDIVGFVFVSCLTAPGGGTPRDVLPERPVLWMQAPV